MFINIKFINFKQFLFLLIFSIFYFYNERLAYATSYGLSEYKTNKIRNIFSNYQIKTTKELLIEAKNIKNIGLQNLSAIKKIIQLKKYSGENFDAKGKTINDIKDMLFFLENNKFFYGRKKIIKNIENIIINNDIKFSEYKNLIFNGVLIDDLSISFKLYDFYARLNFWRDSDNQSQRDMISSTMGDLAKQIWQSQKLTPKQEDKFLKVNSHFLYQSDHISKISQLIWNKKYRRAKNMSRLVRSDYRELFESVIKIRTSKRDLNLRKIITKIDENFRGLEMVYYALARYYHKRDNQDKVMYILSLIPSHAKYSYKWWKLRNLYGRELLKDKQYQQSYQIMVNHGIKKGTYDYAAAEWLLGWISLRYLQLPQVARIHFKNMYEDVGYPISLSRGAYWIGMTYEGDLQNQNYWYDKAAQFPMYFYGQIAINKLNGENKIFGSENYYKITKDRYINKVDNEIKKKIFYSDVARILYIALYSKQETIFKKTLEKFIEHNNENEIIALIDILYNDRNVDYKIVKLLERKKIFLIDNAFRKIDSLQKYKDRNLLQSIMKQESGFDQAAVSSAGAIGLMQVMPDTAKIVARSLGIKYSLYKLKNNKNYNIRIGSAYLRDLLKRFNGSQILAIASYNAGPHNALRWIKENGDVRDLTNIDKIIDWIESITYYETRNYVQRIIENINIYSNKENSVK